MASPVTIEDLEARWRPLSPVEMDTAQALLDDAWAVLLTTVSGDIDTLVAGDANAEQVVRAVVSGMVLRMLRNPGQMVSETIGPYSYRVADGAATGLFMTPAELRFIRMAFGFGGAVYSVPMSTPADVSYPYTAG